MSSGFVQARAEGLLVEEHSTETSLTQDSLPLTTQPLVLASTSEPYSVVSRTTSSGYFAVQPEDFFSLSQQTEMPQVPNLSDDQFELFPDYRSNPVQAIALRVDNQTSTKDWVLHVSNFGPDQYVVWLKTGQEIERLTVEAGHQPLGNALGRAISLSLPAGEQTEIVLQQYATHKGWIPYVGLMTAEHYSQWSARVDFIYQAAVGVILGLSVAGLLCWLLLREPTFFWASISALCVSLYYLEHGYLFEHFYGVKHQRGDSFWWIISLSSASLLAFAGSFIQLGKGCKALKISFYSLGIIAMLLPFIAPYVSFFTKAALYALVTNALMLAILISALIKIRSSGRYYLMYLLGWLPLCFTIGQSAWFFFADWSEVSQLDVSYKLIWEFYLHVLHVLIHIIALVDRVRRMRIEKAEAVRLSNAKSLYMAHSSHDLHQPIYCMNLYADALRPFLKQPQALEILDKLQTSQSAMSRSLQQIMDLNRLEAGVIQPQIQAVALQSLFNEVQGELAILAQEKGLKLRFCATTRWVQTDPDLLLRMVKNLVSNAIRYTEKGGVLVGCRHRAGAIELQVIDTGQGMSDDAISQVFDIYQRVSSGEQDGAGIGLSIVKHLAELLNHPIQVSSRLGQGSCFSLRLPLTEKPVNCQPLAKPETIALVCPEAGQRYLTDYFMAQGFGVESFASVSAAVAAAVDNQIAMLVCHASLLAEPELELISQAASLKNCTLVAIDADSLPSHWLQLRSAMNLIQLRALLNFHQRKANH
ncbi:sensor histidine kinase [Reinekea thalattae]|uniref:sensor histidine kinase n=1 Tax=Reinekea thalattae TaxID=2593301 RepID=UPI00164FEBAB|nr:sensor histidine kinase [Reinekea thalattae]